VFDHAAAVSRVRAGVCNTITEAMTSAGMEGQPPVLNRSANICPGNNSRRCAARNASANTPPAGSRCPAGPVAGQLGGSSVGFRLPFCSTSWASRSVAHGCRSQWCACPGGRASRTRRARARALIAPAGLPARGSRPAHARTTCRHRRWGSADPSGGQRRALPTPAGRQITIPHSVPLMVCVPVGAERPYSHPIVIATDHRRYGSFRTRGVLGIGRQVRVAARRTSLPEQSRPSCGPARAAWVAGNGASSRRAARRLRPTPARPPGRPRIALLRRSSQWAVAVGVTSRSQLQRRRCSSCMAHQATAQPR
jgi:hypothetical protein